MAQITLAIEAGQGAAVADEPLVVVLDEAGSINWNADAVAFVDAISGGALAASVGGVDCACWIEQLVQTAGSRKLVAHVRMPTCVDGTTVLLDTTRSTISAAGVPAADATLYAPCQVVDPLDNLMGTALVSGNVSQATGKLAGAASYNGSTSQSVGGKPACASGFSIMGWFKPTAGANYQTQIWNQWGTAGAGRASWVLQSWNYIMGWFVNDGSTTYAVAPMADIRTLAGTWHHIACCYEPGIGTSAFIDGVSAGTPNASAVCQTSTTYDVTIGRQASGGNYYTGLWDQLVMVVGDCLDATDVGLHYRNEGDNGAFWSDPVAVGGAGAVYRPWLMTGGRLR